MTTWEYLIVELPNLEPPTHAPGASAAVHALNNEGQQGWEAVGLTLLAILNIWIRTTSVGVDAVADAADKRSRAA